MSTQSFDPYYKWLGIPPAEQPANHYRLLGINLLEADPDVISNAADQRMLLVKNFQAGRWSGMSQQILNELAAAKLCLLNPQKKAAYDEQFRPQPRTPAAARSPPIPGPPSLVAPPVRGEAFAEIHNDADVFEGAGGDNLAGFALFVALGAALVLLGILVWWLAGAQHSRLPEPKPQEFGKSAPEFEPHDPEREAAVPSPTTVPPSPTTAPPSPTTAPPSPAVAPFDSQQAAGYQWQWAEHLGYPAEWINSIGMSFKLIPPGEFMMGSSEEQIARLLQEAKQRGMPPWYIDRLSLESPQHHVKITQPFYLGRYEVTQAEYRRVTGDNPSRFHDNKARPVENVTWHDAVDFCRRLNELPQERQAGALYRLPTEAEWEYACRAGTPTSYSFGDHRTSLGQYAWWGGNSKGQPQPVGQLHPNAWGLFDMHGNVWEWCADWFDGQYYTSSPGDDPRGPASGNARINRGGSWDAEAGGWRSAVRDWYSPGGRSDSLGFRVVLVPAE